MDGHTVQLAAKDSFISLQFLKFYTVHGWSRTARENEECIGNLQHHDPASTVQTSSVYPPFQLDV
jgi:hypothetical protein